jgi:hypothetical protein
LRRIEKNHGELTWRGRSGMRRQLNATELRAVSIARVAVRIANAAASTGWTRAVQQSVDIRGRVYLDNSGDEIVPGRQRAHPEMRQRP